MISPSEINWAAGFLEGEGYFGFDTDHPRIIAGQVQRWPVDLLMRYFGGTIRLTHTRKHPFYLWVLSGHRAIGLMMTLYNLLSPKRQDKIRFVFSEWKSRRPAFRYRRACSKGHEYTKHNTISIKSRIGRGCRICKNREAD